MTDVFALKELMNELGYNTTKEEMTIRINTIHKYNDNKTFIATNDKQISGMVGLTKNYFYEQNRIYVSVVALVIIYQFRQNGIGRNLMKTAES